MMNASQSLTWIKRKFGWLPLCLSVSLYVRSWLKRGEQMRRRVTEITPEGDGTRQPNASQGLLSSTLPKSLASHQKSGFSFPLCFFSEGKITKFGSHQKQKGLMRMVYKIICLSQTVLAYNVGFPDSGTDCIRVYACACIYFLINLIQNKIISAIALYYLCKYLCHFSSHLLPIIFMVQ